VVDNGINERSLLVYLVVLAFGAGLAIGIFAWGRFRRPAAKKRRGLSEA
jgi:hypothetical protein